jgi:predicted phosphoribosyltransferase
MMHFSDRQEAGRRLAPLLSTYAARPATLVLGLPRGGVLVAAEVARSLQLPLDVFTVRKLGVPWNRELAVGALASGGVQVLDRDLMAELGLTMRDMQPVLDEESVELARREQVFRGGRPPLDLRGTTVILADDGLATGATMAAAVDAVRQAGAREIVVAVPVASDSACEALQRRGVRCVSLSMPRPFYGVGRWYDDFHDTSDAEVLEALEVGA